MTIAVYLGRKATNKQIKKIKTKFLRCTGYLNSIKNPIKQDLLLILVRTTTELSKLLNSCLTAVKKLVIKYCEKVYERSGKKPILVY